MSQMRVVVVGAGAVGVCSALYLQHKGCDVTLIESQAPGAGASYGNASVLACDSVAPIAMPGVTRKVPGMLLDPMGPLRIRWSYLPKLAPWLLRFLKSGQHREVERIASALASLLSGCIEDYRPLLKQAGAEALLVERGWIGVYLSSRSLSDAAYATELQQRHGVSFQKLSAEEVRELEPAVSTKIVGGYYYPGVAHVVDSHRLTFSLAEAFVRKGGTLLQEQAKDFLKGSNGRVSAVRTDRNEHPCDSLVLAAGAWSRDLASRLGAKVPLDTERGYHYTVSHPGIELSRPVYVPETGLACTPLGDRLRLAGTVEFGGLNAAPDWDRANVLARRGKELFPELDIGEGEQWLGFRPSMPDSLPVIGPVSKTPNAFLAFGHGHLGVTLAARTGRMISEMVMGTPTCVDPEAYRATRF